MNRLPLPLRYTDLLDGTRVMLDSPFAYCRGPLQICVPTGFITDFASTPRLLWRIMPPFGRWNGAAVIHDYLYSTGCLSRALSDSIFLEVMLDLGVPTLKALLMYVGVVVCGRRHYKGESG